MNPAAIDLYDNEAINKGPIYHVMSDCLLYIIDLRDEFSLGKSISKTYILVIF